MSYPADLTWRTITRPRFEKLVADIRQLRQTYNDAAANDDNQTECMYGDVCGEIADALWYILNP